MDDQHPINEYDDSQTIKPFLYLFGRIVAIILIVCFSIATVFNLYVLINGFLKQNGYPSAFGITPIVVVPSDDSEADKLVDIVNAGDLLLALGYDMEKYVEGDPVAFTHNGVILIGEISSIENRPGNVLAFRVQAAYLEGPFDPDVTEKNLLGDIQNRIPLIGYFILFLSTIPGRLIFVGIPLLIYIILVLVGAWLEAEAYRRARRTFRTPVSGRRVPLGEVSFWSYLSTALFAMAAIGYGTHDSHVYDKAQKKRSANAQKEQGTVFRGEPIATHPVRMRHTYARRPCKPRSTRAIKPIAPAQRPRVPTHVDIPRSSSTID